MEHHHSIHAGPPIIAILGGRVWWRIFSKERRGWGAEKWKKEEGDGKIQEAKEKGRGKDNKGNMEPVSLHQKQSTRMRKG